MRLMRLADVRALRAASAMGYCNHLRSPGMMLQADFPDIYSPHPTLTWTSREDIQVPECDKSTVQLQQSVESSSNVLASHYEIMTASRDKGSPIMAWDPCARSPTTRVFKRYQHWRANIVLEWTRPGTD